MTNVMEKMEQVYFYFSFFFFIWYSILPSNDERKIRRDLKFKFVPRKQY